MSTQISQNDQEIIFRTLTTFQSVFSQFPLVYNDVSSNCKRFKNIDEIMNDLVSFSPTRNDTLLSNDSKGSEALMYLKSVGFIRNGELVADEWMNTRFSELYNLSGGLFNIYSMLNNHNNEYIDIMCELLLKSTNISTLSGALLNIVFEKLAPCIYDLIMINFYLNDVNVALFSFFPEYYIK